MDTLQVPAEVRARWLHVGALKLGQSLVVFYRQLEQWLALQGVAAADYVVVQIPTSQAAPAAAAAQRATDSLPASPRPEAIRCSRSTTCTSC